MALTAYEEGLMQSLRIRQSSTVASLVVLLYECMIMSRKEFRSIWRRPVKLNQVVYLFSRYFGIIVQGVNAYLALGPYGHLAVQRADCKKWLLFQAMAAYALTGALHIILMLMVFALHLKDWRVGVFLVILFFYQIAMQVLITPKAILNIEYDSICDTNEIHPDTMLYLGTSTGVTYLSLVVLTAFKRNILLLGAPIVKRVIRDGAWIIIVLASLFSGMLSYSWVRQGFQGHVMFGWSNTIVSIACCRIIMNMETLEYAEPECDEVIGVGFGSFDEAQLARFEMDRREGLGSAMDIQNTIKDQDAIVGSGSDT